MAEVRENGMFRAAHATTQDGSEQRRTPRYGAGREVLVTPLSAPDPKTLLPRLAPTAGEPMRFLKAELTDCGAGGACLCLGGDAAVGRQIVLHLPRAGARGKTQYVLCDVVHRHPSSDGVRLGIAFACALDGPAVAESPVPPQTADDIVGRLADHPLALAA